MGTSASASWRVASRVSRRATLARAIRLGGPSVLIGASIGVIGVAASRAMGLFWPWEAVLGVPPACGLVVACGLAWSRRWSPLRSAVEAERALGLGSRVSTSLALSGAGSTGGFDGLAIADGEAAAARVDPASVVPLRWGRSWWFVPVAAAAGVASGMWMPRLAWNDPATPDPALAEARDEAATSIADATEVVREVVARSDAAQGVATTQDLSELDELQRELERGGGDPMESRTRAASAVERAAERAEDEAARSLEADRALRERLATSAARPPDAGTLPGVDAPESGTPADAEGAGDLDGDRGGESPTGEVTSPNDAPPTGQGQGEGETGEQGPMTPGVEAARAVEEALSRGDLEGARDAVERLQRELERMTPEEREEVARELRDAADRVDPGSEGQSQDEPEAAAGQDANQPREGDVSGGDEQNQDETSEGADREDGADGERGEPSPGASGEQGRETTPGPEGAENPRREERQPGAPGERAREPREGGSESRSDEPGSTPREEPGRENQGASSQPEGTRQGQTDPGQRGAEQDPQSPIQSGDGETGSRESPGTDPARARELQERGLSEGAARDVSRQTDPQRVRERLEEEGMDPASADRVAREIARENQQQAEREAGQEQARRDARDLSESLRRAADEVERPPRPDTSREGQEPPREQGGSRPEGPQDQPRQGDPGGQPRPEAGEQPQGPEPTPGSQPGRQGEPSPAGESNPGPGREAPSGEPGTGPSGTPAGQPGQQLGDQAARPGPPQGNDPREPGPEGRIDGTDGDPSTQRDERSPAGEGGGTGDGSPEDLDRALDMLERDLDRLAGRGEDVRRRLDDAERLRDQADDLLGRTTPEQRERLSRLARELADRERASRPSPGATEFERVQASRPSEEGREQVISQWLGEPGETDGQAGAGRAEVDRRLREAAAGAERAIEQQEVPARHADLIRRVFRRHQERAGSGERAEDARDGGG